MLSLPEETNPLLMKGKTGIFAKTSFYFLQVSPYHRCYNRVTSKTINQGDGKGIKVPRILAFTGRSQFVEILIKELKKHV